MISGLANVIGAGFSGTFSSIGIVIILGALIGSILEVTGAALKLADIVINLVGEKNPVLGLSGGLGKGAMDICDYGIASLMTTVNSPMELTEALERAEELYYEGAVRMFRFVKTGMDMRR